MLSYVATAENRRRFLTHFCNLTLRGLTILFRFLLVFIISKYYSIEDLGVFGLFNTTVTIVIFFLGFDFYTYSHREIVKVEKLEQSHLIVSSFSFFLFTYLVVLPPCLLVFAFGVLPSKLIFWFYGLIFLEHLGQELYRLFVLFSRQLFANVLLFVRLSVWIVPLSFYWFYTDYNHLSLDQIFLAWSVGALVSISLGLVGLKRHFGPNFVFRRIDWGWIKAGIPTSLQYLVGTLAYKVIEFSDRYFLDYYLDKKAVGIYTFYYNFANVLQTLVFTLVIAQLYPRLIELYGKKDFVNFGQEKLKFKKQVSITSLLASVLMAIAIFPVAQLIGKPEFVENLAVYGILIVAVTILNISFIAHYVLYAKNQDNVVMISTIIAASVNVICNFILTSRYGLIGSALSTFISYSILAIVKFYYMNQDNEK